MSDEKDRDAFMDMVRRWREHMTPEQIAAIEATTQSIIARCTPRPLEPGEGLRWFSSPPDAWGRLAGRGGYEILRDGVVVERVVTHMN